MVGRARPAFVDQADDAAGEARGVVGLDARRVDADEAPAGGYQFPFIGRISVRVQLRRLKEWALLERLPRGMLGKMSLSDGSCWMRIAFNAALIWSSSSPRGSLGLGSRRG